MSAAAAAQAGASLAGAAAGLIGTSMQIRAANSARTRALGDMAAVERERSPGVLHLLREKRKLVAITARRAARRGAAREPANLPLMLGVAAALLTVVVVLKKRKKGAR